MGSGSSYRGTKERYSSYAPPPSGRSSTRDPEADRRAEEERTSRVRGERAKASTAPPPREDQREKRDTRGLYDRRLVRNRITRPDAGAHAVTVLLIDNSGSNRVVAERMRESSGYMLATMGTILGKQCQVATIYGSDHGDGSGYRQDVDFIFPTEEGDRILFSTTHDVHNASGGDEAEAFECLLHETCDIDFGHIAVPNRHLILATDVVGHGMGMHSDDGCRLRDWRQSVERVYGTFGTFQVIGTGESESMGKLQAKFLRPERVALDLLDMSAIRDTRHRLGIIPNAALFLMARNDGPQTVKVFLQFLYEKWLSDPVFGQDTDLRARDAIRRFFKYVEGMNPEMEAEWARAIFVD